MVKSSEHVSCAFSGGELRAFNTCTSGRSRDLSRLLVTIRTI
jgi:hypothetical protein